MHIYGARELLYFFLYFKVWIDFKLYQLHLKNFTIWNWNLFIQKFKHSWLVFRMAWNDARVKHAIAFGGLAVFSADCCHFEIWFNLPFFIEFYLSSSSHFFSVCVSYDFFDIMEILWETIWVSVCISPHLSREVDNKPKKMGNESDCHIITSQHQQKAVYQ